MWNSYDRFEAFDAIDNCFISLYVIQTSVKMAALRRVILTLSLLRDKKNEAVE